MKRLVVILFVTLSAVAYSQEKWIELKHEAVKTETNGFYISGVIDGRQNRDSIGFVQTGLADKSVSAHLYGGLENSLFNYLKNAYPRDTSQTPIVIIVKHLSISETSAFTLEKARAEIKLEFYKTSNGKLGKVYATEYFVEKQSADVSRGHEKRIKTVLDTCIERFNESDWKTVQPEFKARDRVEPADVDTTEADGSETVREDSVTNSLLTFHMAFGMNASGWSLSYYRFVNKKTSNWIIPWMVSIEAFTINPEIFQKTNYYEARLSYWMPGVSAFKRLSDRLYLNLTLLIPVGRESLTTFYGNVRQNFLFGFAPAQGLYFIPKSNRGLTFGIGVFERVLSSEVYSTDIGFKAEVGFKF